MTKTLSRTASGPSPLLVPHPYRVIDKIDELADTVTMYLAPVDGVLPDFEPAQVSMLGAFGVGEAAISISHATPSTHGYTIRRAGAITNALVDTPAGGVITVRGPFGNHWPIEDVSTSNLLIIAGGLGIAPLRAITHAAANQIDRFESVVVIYGAKQPDQIMYRTDLEHWAKRGVDVRLTADDAGSDTTWSHAVGLVPALLGDHAVDLDWAETSVFTCGPDVMMHFTAERLLELGVRDHRIWLSVERNMQCGNALCGHCQLGPFLVCRDGPVANYAEIAPFHRVPGL